MSKIFVRVALLLSLLLVASSLYHMGQAHFQRKQAEERFEKQEQVIQESKPVVTQEPVKKAPEPIVEEEPTLEETFLSIPKLKRKLPVVEGIDKKTLLKGVGHIPTTVNPNGLGISILAGHNDTVFSKIDVLKPGDEVVINNKKGDTVYTIKERKIVSKKYLLPMTEQKKSVLVLITCYPMWNIGDAPERLILTAEKTPPSKR
jgi:sortase A